MGTPLEKNAETNALAYHSMQLTGVYCPNYFFKDSDVIRTTVISLKNSLPQVYKKNDNRDKRSPTGLIVGSTILSGVFGTLMGWFTHKRLTNETRLKVTNNHCKMYYSTEAVFLVMCDQTCV